jgi:hypothetical protein
MRPSRRRLRFGVGEEGRGATVVETETKVVAESGWCEWWRAVVAAPDVEVRVGVWGDSPGNCRGGWGGTGDGLAGWWHHLSHGRAVPEGVKSSREQRRRTIPVEEEGRRSPAEEVYAVVEEATQGSCTHPNARRIAC